MSPKPLRRKLAIFAAALTGMLVATAQPALAWGELGHRTVGEIAYANVKPEVRADRRTAQGRGGVGHAFVQGGESERCGGLS
jgi:hypothetical protein